jgi:hypothetical protein
MMKNNLTRFASFILLAATFASCSKDSSAGVITVTSAQAKDLNGEGTGSHYAFFSIERNEVVALADSNTTKWDIAVRSTNIITNSGTSGPGAGGAYVQKAVTFDNFKTIPADSVFRTDASTALAIKTGSGNGWYNYDFNTNIISPIPGNVIVVRTATGKYAKIEILSYYKGAPATPAATDLSRYYTFRFVYQANGSKTFE